MDPTTILTKRDLTESKLYTGPEIFERGASMAATADMPVTRNTKDRILMTEILGRGRAMVAAELLRAGEVVLVDSPIVVYSALPLMTSEQRYCAYCFKVLTQSQKAACPSCSSVFCSVECKSVADASSHTPWACQALIHLRSSPLLLQQSLDRQVQAQFLVAAYNLSLVSSSAFRILLSLQGEAATVVDEATVFLHSLLLSVLPPEPGVSLELTASLLVKDKLNAFGLMEPFSDDGRERSVRAYGIYTKASFFNHDCLPNACRFDYVDYTESPNNTDIIIRLIHDVPQGREICLSYFPVNLNYSDRQLRLKEDYGFICDCDRCKVEANWSEEEEEMDSNQDGVEGEETMMQDDTDEHMVDSDTENGALIDRDNNDFPHAYFFLRYMCQQPNCWGTLAPRPPPNIFNASTTSSVSVMECNTCGNLNNLHEMMDGDAS